ncbi:AzlD domain-containing protein [Janthinobacterium agaricidamnosum]|uniref:Branched-chain amino acid transport family protein n=1 Tax=Janthinobacterium agaricidamnosum NBRC 102515 = DSM 9628 TaxID=1349767 RepID=W0UZY5_9BURK|nr:AzlD domain-containing protein [Janthinobacterium agaricidamnosum]CDG81186.1 branched-chain amino acid transport family protein [Janthinobacterium agaricidamnosum NBRC 102515 = DSM 9628]
MAQWEIWLTILVLGVATAATRSSFWLIGHHITIPKRVNEVLRFAPACALAAIIAPDLLLDGQEIHFGLSNWKLLSGVAAAVFYVIGRNMLQTIVFGMLVFTGLRLLQVFQ